MIKLNNYILEAWNGVKKQSYEQEIKSWCEEMGIKNYTINSKGEIDVDGDVWLINNNFKELPYKFGYVNDMFSLNGCKNLTSLKNCPDFVARTFSCSFCPQLDSLEGCPKKVMFEFICSSCKRKFTKEEVQKYCNVKKHDIIL